MRRAVLALACWLTLVGGACSSAEYDVVVHVPGGSTRAIRVEVSILGSCADVEEYGDAPARPVRQVSVAGGRSAPLGTLAAGRYGLYARAWEQGCSLYAAGCNVVTVDGEEGGTLEVFLREVQSRGCDADQICRGDDCSGIDAGLDAAPDSSLPPPEDAGPDAPLCVPCAAPHVIGSLPTRAVDVDLQGEVAYSGGMDGLVVIDLSDPTNPRAMGTAGAAGGGGWRGLDADGGLACVAADISGIHVFDVSNPAAPTYLATADTPGYAVDVAVHGTLAYVADGSEGLQIVDLAVPGVPVVRGGSAVPSEALAVAVEGTTVYVLSQYEGVQVIDASDPDAPRVTGTLTPEVGEPIALALQGTTLYVTLSVGTLDVWDLEAAQVVGSVAVADTVPLVAVAGSFAVVPDFGRGVSVVDVADPSAPTVLGTTRLEMGAMGVATDDRLAVFATGNTPDSAVAVVDFGCPAR